MAGPERRQPNVVQPGPGPYARPQQRPQQRRPDDEFDKAGFIRVSATSNPKAVAGKIAHACREGDPPAILLIGPACINQAVKAIAIARGFLKQDNLDISFQPAFRDPDRTKPQIALYIAKQRPCRATYTEAHRMSVSAASVPNVVAGAIAARVRESQEMCLIGIGVDAVTNAVMAVGNSRLFLEKDKFDVRAYPEFVHVQKGNTQMSAMRFDIVAERI